MGADTKVTDNDGWNALDLAIIKMNYKTALWLLEKTEL